MNVRWSVRRREFIALMGASVTWPFLARAQEPGRTYRLGCLAPFPRLGTALQFLFDELHRRGFVEGQNLTVEYRQFSRNNDLEYASELVEDQVDVIYAAGVVAIRAAQQATKTIPILAITDDMLGEGLVTSLARPNGNTTGLSMLASELDGKRQEILIEAVPGIRRMAALADSNVTPVAKLNELQEAARARKIELSIHQVTRGDQIATAIDTAHASGVTALNVLASPMLFANRKLIFDRVAALHLPAIYQWPPMAEQGGFVAYGPDAFQINGEILARELVQLFRGVRPADIPVEQPTKFELWINLKTANALGVTVPESLLVRADKVIE
jgi:putative tryptophan/tyrosine transport system substrate-binding protein